MKKLTQWEKGWLSGIIDSDGGVYFNRANGKKKFITCRIQIDGASEVFIQTIKKLIGYGSIYKYREKKDKGLLGKTFRPMYRYTTCSNTIRWLLPQLTLIAKKRQQEIILKALPLLGRNRWRTDEQDKILIGLFEEMREINMKGSKKESKWIIN